MAASWRCVQHSYIAKNKESYISSECRQGGAKCWTSTGNVCTFNIVTALLHPYFLSSVSLWTLVFFKIQMTRNTTAWISRWFDSSVLTVMTLHSSWSNNHKQLSTAFIIFLLLKKLMNVRHNSCCQHPHCLSWRNEQLTHSVYCCHICLWM